MRGSGPPGNQSSHLVPKVSSLSPAPALLHQRNFCRAGLSRAKRNTQGPRHKAQTYGLTRTLTGTWMQCMDWDMDVHVEADGISACTPASTNRPIRQMSKTKLACTWHAAGCQPGPPSCSSTCLFLPAPVSLHHLLVPRHTLLHHFRY